MNKKLTPDERKERIALLFKHHEEFLKKEGISKPLFMPKMAYVPEGKDDKCITFFTSELEQSEKFDTPKDIYVEFADIMYNSEDPDRGLYKWKFNPHWRTEYDIVTSKAGYERYAIPIDELHFVTDDKKKASSKPLQLEFDVDEESSDDALISDMTIRDLAAILLKKPVSKKQWLNKLIK